MALRTTGCCLGIDSDPSRSSKSPSRWAILVGIDLYSTLQPNQNLKGCCNDAVLMYNFLHNSLGIPECNIYLHLARHDASPAVAPEPHSTSPTYWNFLESIKRVETQAKPGDFVHIHFSGHGTRKPTEYKEEKSTIGLDERLCFVDNEMPDVEFGETLDTMAAAPYHLVILATLDCCFSGGATRWGESVTVRCKPEPQDSPTPTRGFHDAESQNPEEIDHTSRAQRTATLSDGWLYRNRDYNALTACLPYEISTERPNELGQIHGVFTWNLISRLTDLGNRRIYTTYAMLQGFLEAVLKGNPSKVAQRPMLLGPRNRILFESRENKDFPSFAHVVKVGNDMLVLDKGESSGARVGDVYQLFAHSKSSDESNNSDKIALPPSDDTIEVTITTVREYDSDATLGTKAGQTISADFVKTFDSGQLAKLVRRVEEARVQVLHDGAESSIAIIRKIQTEWKSYIDPAVPIHLYFSGDEEYPNIGFGMKFYVAVSRGVMEVRTSENRPYEHLPTILTTRDISSRSADITRRLMYLLRHMQGFVTILELRDRRDQNELPFSLTIREINGPLEQPSVVSSRRISFLNKHTKTLFVTVFNLTPLHGAQQILPSDEGHGRPVGPGDGFEPVIDFQVPEPLAKKYREDHFFKMRDTLKIFVTTEHVDLRHFELKDVENDEIPIYRHRHAHVRTTGMEASWWVEDYEVITRSSHAAHNAA